MFKGMTKTGKTILIISLAANLAIIGLFIGHKISHWRGHHHHGLKAHVIKVMPEAKRDAVEGILKAFKEKHPKRRGRGRKNWAELDKHLRAENFDRAAFTAAVTEAIEKHNQRFIDGGNAIADIAELLTYEERVDVLNKIREKMQRRRRFFKHRHHDKK